MGKCFDIVINANFAAHVWSLPFGTRKEKQRPRFTFVFTGSIPRPPTSHTQREKHSEGGSIYGWGKHLEASSNDSKKVLVSTIILVPV